MFLNINYSLSVFSGIQKFGSITFVTPIITSLYLSIGYRYIYRNFQKNTLRLLLIV
jgi:hypothetical protein